MLVFSARKNAFICYFFVLRGLVFFARMRSTSSLAFAPLARKCTFRVKISIPLRRGESDLLFYSVEYDVFVAPDPLFGAPDLASVCKNAWMRTPPFAPLQRICYFGVKRIATMNSVREGRGRHQFRIVKYMLIECSECPVPKKGARRPKNDPQNE